MATNLNAYVGPFYPLVPFFDPLSGNAPHAPYLIILLCQMPVDLTHQGQNAATQWTFPLITKF